ncbi:carboxymuconolactone decarboxylase family protein [Actinocorallia lasiicapitis]
MSDKPRIAPATPEELAPGPAGVVSAIGPLNIFTTLGRHPELFDSWIRLGGYLLASKTLCPRIRELIILRVAHVTGCDYERIQHEPIALGSGVVEHELAALREPLDEHDWDPGERPVLAAVDELHAGSTVSDATWARLAAVYDEKGLIEVIMLIGHYVMVAYALNALKVQPES